MKEKGRYSIRIVGGRFSGLRIIAPSGQLTRPTGERVREAVFNSLQGWISGARVLDLYAGSGAMGLESLSWGASYCLFVEPNRQALNAIRTNILHLNVKEMTELWSMTAEQAVERLQALDARFDLIICDPPWRQGLSPMVRMGLVHLLMDDGIALIEHPSGTDFGPFEGLHLSKQRKYGGTTLSYWVHEDSLALPES
ncbi:16S rRNA (guanine966-N2)-methyltransferase [Sulfobacillus thermosulfidooxidans DSM 9293]|uniref:16S rRNA (Guanine966-N2)-methyltransferase n=1 Tax=Sulfobacillus thermosulfidooxidans (strain DSM 9293 / VKM B-1269 / AT-1) TaxID=929705 RepID=A0A1W1WNX1_SULTA|nr:16S rRNA (guanine(966)-N(2))-methyltransferase RsmD [Sulfobacillus thermosulfidooxidans]SMC07423.1 16S rRNA (guanine966-N2)-methyltransferase [Sulfobacillus thermosulfidooxidans DSM 9293]